MAKCEVKLPEDFLLKLSNLAEKTDEIIPKVLKAGGEVVEDKVKSNLQSVIGKETKCPSRSTGQLLSALGVSGARQDKDGNFNVKIGFAENRNDGKNNAMLASILEYGKHNQPAKPFMKPAKTQSKSACVEAMINKFDEEAGKI